MIYVAFGGFFGAISRFVISSKLSKNSSFPKGTLAVNLVGSLLLGLIFGLELPTNTTLLLGTGFLGAFTTFSTLSLELVNMIQGGRSKHWMMYVIFTYGGGLLLAYAGFLLGNLI